MKVTNLSTQDSSRISGDVIRLPPGFDYNKIDRKLTLANEWEKLFYKDVSKDGLWFEESGKIFICENLWILRSRNESLNAVFGFAEYSIDLEKQRVANGECVIFGFSLTAESKIEGEPMCNTRHTDTYVNLIITDFESFQKVLQMNWIQKQ